MSPAARTTMERNRRPLVHCLHHHCSFKQSATLLRKMTNTNSLPINGKIARDLRRRQGMTLEVVANHIDVSKGHLSRFERGEKALSVSVLMRLSKVLGVSVATLLGEAPQAGIVHVVRSDNQKIHPASADEGRYEYVPLARESDLHSSAFIAKLNTECLMQNDAHHSGEEMLYVLSGSLELLLETTSVLLRAGDFAQFPGWVKHKLKALQANTDVLIVVTNFDSDAKALSESLPSKGSIPT
ncbi:helix-turn-helix transcriptional regulator [Variovorax rhizosphaerae]|uniref:Helix-turn-helix transcriptional regulator n=1 Tax=Variovorax rhizosphaerae TaxID=1836200 RepID=A0ABU8WRD6_9BURK